MSKQKSHARGNDGFGQVALFTEEQLPHRDDLVELVKRGFDHNAKRLMEGNELVCRDVMVALLRGVSGRRIARDFKMSRNSVAGIRKEMEKRGLVEPLKKEISGLLGDIISMGLEDMKDAIAEGRLHASQLPVPLGIFMTHKALVDGDPTVRVESGRPVELSVESVTAHFERMKKASVQEVQTVAVEGESTVNGEERQ